MSTYQKIKRLIKKACYIYEDCRDGDVLRKNGILKDAYKGERCFIICTGASLKSIAIKQLRNEFTFGCNFSLKHPDCLPYSFYAMAIRPVSMRRTARSGLAGENHDPGDYFQKLEDFYRGRRAKIFLHRSAKKYFDKKRYLRDQELYYVRCADLMENASTLSNDLTKGITFMDGSVFLMIASSIYMGFSELYLCGCDYTYQPIQSGHFYEDETLLIDEPVDPKHQMMKDFAENHGVKIYNVVPAGFESPIYEKIKWEEVLGRISDQKAHDSESNDKPLFLSHAS